MRTRNADAGVATVVGVDTDYSRQQGIPSLLQRLKQSIASAKVSQLALHAYNCGPFTWWPAVLHAVGCSSDTMWLRQESRTRS